jgi:hypothetical protein
MRIKAKDDGKGKNQNGKVFVKLFGKEQENPMRVPICDN